MGLTKILLKTLGQVLPTDLAAHRFPISVKGIIWQDDRVLLLKKEDGYWDLPGGKLQAREAPEECLRRELKEETNLEITVGALLGSFNIRIRRMINVLVLVYDCRLNNTDTIIQLSSEHFDANWFEKEMLSDIKISAEYLTVMGIE